MWLVGTIPGLLIRRLANTTCALAVSLTPCLLAKPLRERAVSDCGEEGALSLPGGASSPEPTEERGQPWPLEMAVLGSVGEEGPYCTLSPLDKSAPAEEPPAAPSPETKF